MTAIWEWLGSALASSCKPERCLHQKHVGWLLAEDCTYVSRSAEVAHWNKATALLLPDEKDRRPRSIFPTQHCLHLARSATACMVADRGHSPATVAALTPPILMARAPRHRSVLAILTSTSDLSAATRCCVGSIDPGRRSFWGQRGTRPAQTVQPAGQGNRTASGAPADAAEAPFLLREQLRT